MGEEHQARRLVGPARRRFASGLRTAYEQGASVRDLAEATCRSYGAIRRLLLEAGVTLRPRGATPPVTPAQGSADDRRSGGDESDAAGRSPGTAAAADDTEGDDDDD